jgi:competence protein ComEA
MLRRSFVGVIVLALACAVSLSAQKEMPKTPPKAAAPKTLDINSAPEADLVALGIDKTAAKKIIEGRPYRNKRELVSRQLLTTEQYDKVKDHIVAKQPPKKN